MSPSDDKNLQNITRQRRIAIVLISLFAAVMLGLGLLAIFSGHFAGTTKQGRLFSADGLTAQWMGGIQICLGMFMLMIAMPNKTAALWWGIIWIALFAICLIGVIHYQ